MKKQPLPSKLLSHGKACVQHACLILHLLVMLQSIVTKHSSPVNSGFSLEYDKKKSLAKPFAI